MPIDEIKFDDLMPAEQAAFNKILALIYQRRGVDFRQYRPKCLRRRVTVRMNDTHQETFKAYLDYLEAHPEECDLLLDRITINVTEFFRNPETYNAVVQKVVPDLIRRKQQSGSRMVRVWSAGCATGEEPYSLAMLLHETLQESGAGLTPRIFATDIDKEAMAIAQEGSYEARYLKGLSALRIKKYFTVTEDGRYRINPEPAGLIKFSNHNMIADPPLRNIDMIFCRNVVIYFGRELQQKVYENFYQALAPGGYLIAGKVETLIGTGEKMFERIDVVERIFRKKPLETI